MAPGWAVSPHASRRTGSRPKPVRQAANRGHTLSDQSRQLRVASVDTSSDIVTRARKLPALTADGGGDVKPPLPGLARR